MKEIKNKLLDKPLNIEEKKLMDSIENEEWEEHPLSKNERKKFIRAAKNTLKDTKINIRINSSDKKKLKKMAAEEGIPYQTFICSILHKYRIGKLIDIEVVRRILQELKKTA